MSAMSVEELLEELSNQRDRYDSYEDLERDLSALMREHHDRVSAHVSADDVLHYASQHGLVQRHGSELVVAAGRTASAV
jgi:hypothetical protein